MQKDASDQQYLTQALRLARYAEAIGEVPVGAIMVLDNGWVIPGWNQMITQHDPTAHAESMALRAAGKQQLNYRLPGATLYVTQEPCAMCAAAIIHARLARVVFGTFDPKNGAAGSVIDILGAKYFNHHVRVSGGILADECRALLQQFFQARRHK